MAEVMYIGGAAIVTQVDTITFTFNSTGWSNDDTPDVVVFDSAGTSVTVPTTISGTPTTAEDVRDLVLTAVNASNSSLFTAIAWTASGTDVILATALVPGVPFFINESLTEADASTGDGTVAVLGDGTGASKLSEGPEDLDVDGSGNYASSNWVTANGAASVKPSANDTARFNSGSFGAKYGLNQSGIDLDEFRRTPSYKGVIGDPVKGLFLRYGVSNANDQAVTINSFTGDTWLHVTTDNVFVVALPRSANALRLKGTVGSVHANGSAVQGTITCPDAMALTNFYADECPAMVAKIGAVTGLAEVHVGAGHVTLDMGVQAISTGVQVWGSGTVIHKSVGAGGNPVVALWECFGGLSEYNGEQLLTELKAHTGTFTLENSTADAVTISTTTQRGGIVSDEGGAVNVTWTTFNRRGGSGSVSATLNQFK